MVESEEEITVGSEEGMEGGSEEEAEVIVASEEETEGGPKTSVVKDRSFIYG